jgi:Pectate lyase superfamily protein
MLKKFADPRFTLACPFGRLSQISILLTLLLIAVGETSATCPNTSGYYNVKTDFGAVGNGTTDDTQKIKDALDCVATLPAVTGEANGGGTIFFPTGTYKVSNGTLLPLSLPSGVTLVGVSGKYKGTSRIQLMLDNESIFSIGGGISRVTVRDLALRTAQNPATCDLTEPATCDYTWRAGTSAIYGNGPSSLTGNSTSINILFSNMDFSGFERAIDVQAHDSAFAWQFDEVKLDHVGIYESDTDIYVNANNGAWTLNNCSLQVDKKSYSILSTAIVLERIGNMTIEDTAAGGPPINRVAEPDKVADAFLWIKGPFVNITLINSISENFYNSIVNDFQSYDSILNSVNCFWGDLVLLRATSIWVSTGTRFHSNTVQAIPPNDIRLKQASAGGAKGTHNTTDAPGATNLLVYSMGDRFDNITSDIRTCPTSPDTGDCQMDFYLGNGTGFSANALVFRSGLNGTTGVDPATDFQKPVRIGNGGCATCYYQVERDGTSTDGTLGYLSLSGMQTGFKGFKFNGNVVPNTTSTIGLGDSAHKWLDIYVVNQHLGDAILTDKKTGEPLYKIHEDPNFIYFDDIRTSKNLMKLDTKGNLFVAGRVFQNNAGVSGIGRKLRKPVKRRH